jgi:RHS repeat-associated protein
MRRIAYVILSLLLLVSSEVTASHEVMSTKARGTGIYAGKFMNIVIPEYNLTEWNVKNSQIFVRLYLAEDRRVMRNNTSQYKVCYTIDLYDFNNSNIVITDSITVDYSQSNGYADINIAKYSGYRSANLLIVSVSGVMPDDIFLELGVDVTKYSLLSTLPSPPDVQGIHQTETNELLLTWGYVGGADEYDVEWLFVDNPSDALSVAYDFSNATRITTSNNHYCVPLAYPKGTILYRVRARGTYVSNGVYYPIFGDWSFLPSKGYSPYMISNEFYFGYGGLEDSLTWQYSAVYAEEGKRKEVISFYDGTLRKRQEVTVNNTNNVAIVSETFYDHVGRQALQSIPTPTPSRGVRYYGTDSTSNGFFNGSFEKADYDYDYTLTHALPFPANAGSAVYHSSNNPFLNDPHWINIAQTPADSGFTYSHTRYLNDGTDRIHSQSALGYTFRMGGGRDTKYYYGNPMQVELDRLFGNEVGDASHYQKVVTVDANGESTVSYYDMKERLIASAIIPSSNQNLLSVDYTPEIEPLIETRVFDENSREYTQSVVVATPTNYTFSYHVKTANALRDTCGGSIGCIDCRYKIVFSLWDPDKLSYVFIDTFITQADIVLQHDTMLMPGNYQLYKSIAVVDDAETNDAYDAYAWRQRPCIHFQGANIARCYTDCEEYAMFLLEITEPPQPPSKEYLQLVQDCENPPQSPNTECEAKRQAMLADMSPGGQYFDYNLTCCLADSLCTCEIMEKNINTFLETICQHRLVADTVLDGILRQLNTRYGEVGFWDTLRKYWQPEYAEVMLKYHPEYHLYLAQCECGDTSAQRRFDSLFFNTNTFDQAVELGLMNPLGLNEDDNIYVSSDPDKGFQPFKSDTIDPFFRKASSCCPDYFEYMHSYIRNRMLSYISWSEGEYNISIWWLLFDPFDISHGGHIPNCNEILYCAEIENMVFSFQNDVVGTWAQEFGCTEKDARWLIFKHIYLYLKEEIKQTVLPGCLIDCCVELEAKGMCDDNNCCNNPSMRWRQYEWWSKLFDNSALEYCTYYLKADTGCSSLPRNVPESSTCGGGYQIRFLCNPIYGLNVDNFMASRDSSLQIVYEGCCADCEAYANSWMEELHDYLLTHCVECLKDTSIWYGLRQELIDLCVESCDHSLANADFSVEQRLDLAEFQNILSSFCIVDPQNYTRIIYPRPTGLFSDCNCQNYQNALHSYGMTFWDKAEDIKNELFYNDGIETTAEDVASWNNFCIWQLYDNMLQNIDDTTSLYVSNFPKQFRCEPELSDLELCQQQAILNAAAQDTITFYHILDSLVMSHRAMYKPHCINDMADTLYIYCHSQEFMYTLYYYDQADNLIKTIPPKGVHPIKSQDSLNCISYYRHNISRYDTLLPGFIYPQHSMVTNYKYNTLNQIITSYQPDHDSVAVTYYDILSRPVLSQNGKQKSEDKYSYTLYDSLGRIVEVGQVVNHSSISQAEATDTALIKAFINDGTRTEITHTYYDKPLLNAAGGTNLRNRIAAVAFYNQNVSNPLSYQTATHYSYDIHGNVKRLVQDIPALSTYSRKLTYIDYEYDLVSGNVNTVKFQEGKPEQLIHRYRYDEDNRLTHVYTSNTANVKSHAPLQKKSYSVIERLEARYFYLPNGLLSRVELGQKKVQGTDYAYTLQGWLKDINGYKTEISEAHLRDIGQDGHLFDTIFNSESCRDAFSSIIQYHQGDYHPVSGIDLYNKEYSAAIPLYNGNISALTTDYLATGITSLVKFFRYDKLNRIKRMETYSDVEDSLCPPSYNYSSHYSYDFNGNLDTLIRYDYDANGLHVIKYEYLSGNNRMDSITTRAGLTSSKYRYDAIGNLVHDTGEGLEISWNASGKVDTIWKNGNVLSTFRYSATGQRQVKETGNMIDYYIHDASGNVMCIYRHRMDTFSVVERPIYGATRLGELKQEINLTIPLNPYIPPFSIGIRQYELTDHLGNVMTTILDRRQPYDNAQDAAYKPYIISTTDYYPFGYPISNRSTNIGGYRYFFNGQEVDNEMFGEVALHTFEFRMHDARLGRFWSVDPLAAKYPWNSTYAFAENRVIDGFDLEGLEYISVCNSGINPSEHKNQDGTYSFNLGESQFNNVSMVQWEGNDYFKIDKHMYYGDQGWSDTGELSEKKTTWVYTDIQNFNPSTMHTYTWGDVKLQGFDKYGNPLNRNCASLANAQANEMGTNLVNGLVSISGALNSVGNTLISLNNSDGIDYINRQLEMGNAVVVGVSYTGGKGTDHYVTITGRTTYLGTGAFTFMENAVSNSANVRDFKSNLFFPNPGSIIGRSPHREHYAQQYNITRIQKNR